MKNGKKQAGNFRLRDFLVVLICLSIAAYSVNLFWNDLFQTLNNQTKIPIGTVTIKRNTVQRRMSDRVLWDRLSKEFPVYADDIIRIADNSEAEFHIGGNNIVLNENTLVRLSYDKDTGEYQIDLTQGGIELVTDPRGGNVALNVMGKRVEAKPGTALNAAAGDNGAALQVSQGTAAITEGGQNRTLFTGDMIAMDGDGAVRAEPAVMVTQPRRNGAYRKSADGPLNVSFSWNRINLQPDETLRLEIAQDRNFSRPVRTLNGLNDSAQTALDAGQWNWRLTYNGAVLDSGRFTITVDAGIELLSPAKNQQFFYETEPPKLFFQWSQTEDVVHYLVEVDVTPEFRNPVIKRQTAAASFSDSSLNEGSWYWRVTPVFSQSGEGAGTNPRVAAQTAAFRIIKSKEPETPQLFAQTEEEPPPAPAPAPAPEPKIVYVPAPAPKPVSRLPAPSNRRPVEGYLVGIEELKKVELNFSWSAVPGANAYLLTVYQETAGGRRQVAHIGPENRTSWTTDIKTLGRGNFVWRVEAVNVGKDNVVERHGNPGENRFVVDIPRPGPARIISGTEVQ
jgi:hypothetical protein